MTYFDGMDLNDIARLTVGGKPASDGTATVHRTGRDHYEVSDPSASAHTHFGAEAAARCVTTGNCPARVSEAALRRYTSQGR
jgi:hypothetical protein